MDQLELIRRLIFADTTQSKIVNEIKLHLNFANETSIRKKNIISDSNRKLELENSRGYKKKTNDIAIMKIIFQ